MTFWSFRPHRSDEKIRNPIQGEFFSEEAVEKPAQALVREVIQNSLDARAGDGPVIVRFGVSAPEGLGEAAARFWLEGAWEHLRAPGSGVRSLPERPLACRFLTIEDFGTTGLNGDPNELRPRESPSRLFAFFRAEGISQKGGRDGGRWGVGKTVFLRASDLNTILCLTVREENPAELIFGQAVLRYHYLRGTYYTPDGALGAKGASAIVPSDDVRLAGRLRRDFGLTRRNEPGLSVVVPRAAEDLTGAAILEAVMREYFYPILTGRLVVTVADATQTAGEKTLTADTLPDELVKANLKDSVGPLAALTLGLRIHGFDGATPLDLPRMGAPAWSESLLQPSVRDALGARYPRGETVLLKVRLAVTAVGEEPRETFFHVALRRDLDDRGGAPAFVRNGIQIPKALERRVRGQSLWALVIIEDQPIATFLGDAETPAHTHWSKDTQNFKGKYRYGAATIDFVRQAPRAIAELLTESAKGRDFQSLADFFPVPRGGSAKGSPAPRPAVDAEQGASLAPPDVSSSPGDDLRIERLDGGFRIFSARGEKEGSRGAFMIAVAYDCIRGNPLRRWDARDFDLASLTMKLDGLRLARCEKNELVVEPEAPRFRLEVTGFDRNRDLYLRVTAEPEA